MKYSQFYSPMTRVAAPILDYVYPYIFQSTFYFYEFILSCKKSGYFIKKNHISTWKYSSQYPIWEKLLLFKHIVFVLDNTKFFVSLPRSKASFSFSWRLIYTVNSKQNNFAILLFYYDPALRLEVSDFTVKLRGFSFFCTTNF